MGTRSGWRWLRAASTLSREFIGSRAIPAIASRHIHEGRTDGFGGDRVASEASHGLHEPKRRRDFIPHIDPGALGCLDGDPLRLDGEEQVLDPDDHYVASPRSSIVLLARR